MRNHTIPCRYYYQAAALGNVIATAEVVELINVSAATKGDGLLEVTASIVPQSWRTSHPRYRGNPRKLGSSTSTYSRRPHTDCPNPQPSAKVVTCKPHTPPRRRVLHSKVTRFSTRPSH